MKKYLGLKKHPRKFAKVMKQINNGDFGEKLKNASQNQKEKFAANFTNETIRV